MRLGPVFYRLLTVLLAAAVFFPIHPALAATAPHAAFSAAPDANFRVAVYIPVGVVEKMAHDPAYLAESWREIDSQVPVNKVYIETYRSGVLADAATIEQVKKFFLDHGVAVAGGIAYAGADSSQFRSFCYTDPKDRAYVKKVAEFTARHFNEIILDDFFFNNTKTPSDIAAKGAKSWTTFRLGLMDEVSRDLVMGAARSVNPKVRIIIKFPNWYPHFQGLGYDLQNEPKIFSGIYTGTETRDPVITDQNLQQYESYQIVRYFDNADPGQNGGGWVDTFSIRTIDRYAEQLWDTMLAKAPQIMLFEWSNLLEAAQPGARSAWQNDPTSFQWKTLAARHAASGSTHPIDFASAAGYALATVNKVVGKLGTPIGLAVYRPYDSIGEDYLENYLGMIGIPINMSPYFPTDAKTVLLTAAAAHDPHIVSEIKTQLMAGKNVVITSGLLKALLPRGIDSICELRVPGNQLMVNAYWGAYAPGSGANLGATQVKPVMVPEIDYLTNDAWPVVRGTADGRLAPLLLMDHYGRGVLYVLTIPDNFNDLYELPQPVLTAIRGYLLQDFPVRIDAPSRVSLFAYNNHTFVVESYRNRPVTITASVLGKGLTLKNLSTGAVLEGKPDKGLGVSEIPDSAARTSFSITVEPHSFAAFAEE